MRISAKKIIISGRVQGVGFRYTAMTLAKRYDISGYVRNISDGSVEMVVQGRKDDIKEYLERISSEFSGYITSHKSEAVEYDPSYSNFKIAY